jgi:hypothetical protein
MSISLPFTGFWLSTPLLLPEDPGPEAPRLAPGLIAAVAGIVAIAAEKARAAGDLAALRDAIEAALGPANDSADPREAGGPDLPCIADADPKVEAARLAALAARGQG